MLRPSLAIVSILLGASLALPAAAQWKWRDSGGHIQYSDLPPPGGVADKDILQRPAPVQRRAALAAAPASAAASAAGTAGVAPKTTEPELEAKRRATERETAEKLKAEEAKVATMKAENCTRAKSYLRSLEDGMRIGRTNAQGEREILDDKGRDDETRRTREVVARDCK